MNQSNKALRDGIQELVAYAWAQGIRDKKLPLREQLAADDKAIETATTEILTLVTNHIKGLDCMQMEDETDKYGDYLAGPLKRNELRQQLIKEVEELMTDGKKWGDGVIMGEDILGGSAKDTSKHQPDRIEEFLDQYGKWLSFGKHSDSYKAARTALNSYILEETLRLIGPDATEESDDTTPGRYKTNKYLVAENRLRRELRTIAQKRWGNK